MYGIFIHPTYRYLEEWLWYGLYDFFGHFTAQEVCYIGPSAPVLCAGHTWEAWWKRNANTFQNTFGPEISQNWKAPRIDDIKKIPSYFIETDFFNELLQDLKTPAAVFDYIRHEEYDKLTETLSIELEKFKNIYNLEILFSHWPCPSLVEACKNTTVQCLFTDMSALRLPRSRALHFFDSTGIHSNSNFISRYAAFKNSIQNSFPIFSKKQLIDIFIREEYKQIFIDEDTNEYDIGIALESSWYPGRISGRKHHVSNDELISLVIEKHYGEKICIRNNPSSLSQLQCIQHPLLKFSDIHNDTSSNSIEFIKKCKKILSVQNNISLESILCDKETCILSENVYKYLCMSTASENVPANNQIEMLNYFIFGYCIPSELRYDKNYIQWRLTHPSEADIYTFNYNHILENTLLNQQYDDIISENPIHKLRRRFLSLYQHFAAKKR